MASGKSRRSKKDRPPSLLRSVLAWNLENLRDEIYSELPSPTARNAALAAAAGTRPSQILRILQQELGCSIDQLDGLAKALRCRPADLLTPYFQRQSPGGETLSKSDAPTDLGRSSSTQRR
jgi:hypothetical protein